MSLWANRRDLGTAPTRTRAEEGASVHAGWRVDSSPPIEGGESGWRGV